MAMGKNNKVCLICGKAYSYCPSCRKTEPGWKNLVDTELCLDIYYALSEYYTSGDAEPIKKVLKENNIKDYSMFAERTINQINEALGKTKSTKKETE